MSSVSVVILNHNGKHHLQRFIPSVIKYSPGCEIVIADNKSDDGSLEYIKISFPEVKIISFDINYGFCEGYNKALSQLTSEYFILLNSDIEVTENWIEPILKLFVSDKSIAAAQPKLLDLKTRNKFEYAGGAGGFIDRFGYPFCRGRIFETIETDHGQYDDTTEIFWASGACLFIRAELFKKYGGFDKDFFAHMEEIDLCWRLKQDGYKIYYCGESTIYHIGGGTLAYANPTKIYLNFRNSLLVLVKNLPSNTLILSLCFRWFMDHIASLKFLVTGNVQDSVMVFKAHIYIWRNLLSIYRKRKSLKQSDSQLTGVYNKILLFTYHIARVRKFSELKF